MKAVVFDEVGEPTKVLRLADVQVPAVGDNEVLVRMLAAPINPGDFLFVQNLYPEPKKPHFPQQIGGNYGAGIVENAGKRVAIKPGTLVSVTYYNTWAEYAVVPEEWMMPLPSDYPAEKAAQFMNLITGWDLVEQSKVQPGQWLLLTAGNSTVAKITSQFAKLKNIKVMSVVRRARNGNDLRAFGASQVVDLSNGVKDLCNFIADVTSGSGIHAVVDCVGGPLFGDLVRSLAIGGRATIYGGFRSERFEVHNFDLLMKGAAIQSYIYRYFFTPPGPEDVSVLQKIAEISGRNDFKVPLGGLYLLDDFKTAIDETVRHPERGKRMFKM
jgi:NADPH2:quinone reductase